MAARIAQLAITSRDPDIAIKACKVGLDKILPNLEEVTNPDNPFSKLDPRDLPGFLAAVDRELAARESVHGKGNGAGA